MNIPKRASRHQCIRASRCSLVSGDPSGLRLTGSSALRTSGAAAKTVARKRTLVRKRLRMPVSSSKPGEDATIGKTNVFSSVIRDVFLESLERAPCLDQGSIRDRRSAAGVKVQLSFLIQRRQL